GARSRARARRAYPGLTSPTVVSEQFTVREDPQARPEVSAGVLVLDAFTQDRVSLIAARGVRLGGSLSGPGA
ncbi:MAG TPA: hypothetical protein VFQ61_32685, partial [Polyangiaceae bacterium]|nr:hypothetical protein [Polyangiaceae bacterium]